MRESFEVGDLVKDALNQGDGAYGLGIVVGTIEDDEENDEMFHPELGLPFKYRVYFTQFERIITFHGDYLEKV